MEPTGPVGQTLRRTFSCVLLWVLGSCAKSPSEADAECPAAPYFTVLPVKASAIASTAVIGGFSPPAHTLPSDHGGIYLNGQGVTLRMPGDLTIIGIRRTTYVQSPFRTGMNDYALDLALCSAVRVTIGHIVTLTEAIERQIRPGGCDRYSTANETVDACYTRVHLPIPAGTEIGTVGGTTAGAFDFGVYDRRHTNRFANPGRYIDQMVTALCPWEPFTPELREILLASVGRGTERRMGDPRCGSMEVDQPGTAQGMWITEAQSTSRASGDESAFITLTYDIVRPAELLLFSIGVPALGAGAYTAPIAHQGTRQRAFGEVIADGAVNCYDVQPGQFRPAGSPRVSFLLSLGVDGRLRLEKREDARGCDDDPAGWAFTAAAVTFVR